MVAEGVAEVADPVQPAGQHVLITGAGRGIGEAIARTLAAQGYRLTLTGRQTAPLQALADSLNAAAGKAVHGWAPIDVANQASVQAAFERARAERGPVQVLVNNAGIVETAKVAKTSLAQWQRMLDVNLTGTFLCSQAALADMLPAKQGRIVNIASTAALVGYAYVAAYTAAKHGVLGLTRALALEVAAQGITVNAICPGYTETDIVRNGIAEVVRTTGRSEEQARAEFVARNPQKKLVQPDEVAQTVAWLCSRGAASVTGQAIAVCGGEVMH